MKTYVKPKIYFESFALSESIATACSADEGFIVRNATNPGTEACFAESDTILPGITIFSNGNCTMVDGESFCITAATNMIPVAFGSV